MTLGQRIQELRKQAGLSQEGLGEALGVSRQAVSKWEGDNGIPELDTLIAMSRLFGITVGQLLGVETPEETADKEEEKAPAGFTEEQVEEILRRYVEESRRQESANQNTVGHYPVGSWIIAACAVIIAAAVIIGAIGRVREVKQSIETLRSDMTDIENVVSNVRNQMGDLSSNIRDQVSSALEEQGNLISTFDYEVYGFDLKAETVDLRLTATLKEYTPGSQLQFVLDWQKTDETKGQTVTEPVSGPKFVAEVTIPMNFHLEISLWEVLPDGSRREQKVNRVYSGMHPDNFSFDVGNVFGPMNNLYVYDKWSWSGSASVIKSCSNLSIISGANDKLFYPVSVHVRYVLTNPREETEQTEESLHLVLSHEEGSPVWKATRERADAWYVFAGARFEATVTIVDNLGRTFIFHENSFVDAKGAWSEKPGIRLDQEPIVVWPKYTPLEQIPGDYTVDQAEADGCVVHANGDIRSGQEQWDGFLKAVDAGQKISVRLADYYELGDPSRYAADYYESIKDEYPKLFLADLTYDGAKYTVRSIEDGEEYVRTYQYLMRYEGEPESKNAAYDSYLRYVLTNDDSVTWEEIFSGVVSSQLGAYIDHYSVYTDYIGGEETTLVSLNEVRTLMLSNSDSKVDRVKELLEGFTHEDLRQHWGAPDGMTSGIWSLAWDLDETSAIWVVFDSEGYVSEVHLSLKK